MKKLPHIKFQAPPKPLPFYINRMDLLEKENEQLIIFIKFLQEEIVDLQSSKEKEMAKQTQRPNMISKEKYNELESLNESLLVQIEKLTKDNENLKIEIRKSIEALNKNNEELNKYIEELRKNQKPKDLFN